MSVRAFDVMCWYDRVFGIDLKKQKTMHMAVYHHPILYGT